MKAIAYCVLRNPSRIAANALRNTQHATRSAFTLIEILVVCAIIGIIMTLAIPSVYRHLHPDSMAKAVTDFMEACSHARASAILNGSAVDLVLDAETKRVSLQAAGSGPAAAAAVDSPSVSGGAWRMDDINKMHSPDVEGHDWRMQDKPRASVAAAPINFSATLPESVAVELIEVNFQDGMDWAEARVRFYPNGTCDEFRMLLVRHPLPGETGGTTERRLITLEVVTGLADMESDMSKMRY